MGTFTTAGIEYEQPPVPAGYGPMAAKAWVRGWHRAIWADAASLKRYQNPKIQAAYDAGHAAARQLRRDSGEQVGG